MEQIANKIADIDHAVGLQEYRGPKRLQIIRIRLIQVLAIEHDGIQHRIHVYCCKTAQARDVLQLKRLREAERHSKPLLDSQGYKLRSLEAIQVMKSSRFVGDHYMNIEVRPQSEGCG